MGRREAVLGLIEAMKEVQIHAPEHLLDIACAVIEDLREKASLTTIRELDDEASWWASVASPLCMEAYLRAIDRELPETPIHHRCRKRILAGMFTSLSDEDKGRFLEWAKDK